MLRFEKWMNDLELDLNDSDKGKILGRIAGECYMKGLEAGLDLTDAEVMKMGEAKFVGSNLGKLVEWYLEEVPNAEA